LRIRRQGNGAALRLVSNHHSAPEFPRRSIAGWSLHFQISPPASAPCCGRPSQLAYVLIVNVNIRILIVKADAYRKLSPQLQGQLRKAAAEDAARWDQDTHENWRSRIRATAQIPVYNTFTPAKSDESMRAIDAIRPLLTEWAKRGP